MFFFLDLDDVDHFTVTNILGEGLMGNEIKVFRVSNSRFACSTVLCSPKHQLNL